MDYHLKPIGKQCAATGQDLVPGAQCFSAVVDRGGELVRLDFSADGWTGPPENSVGYWKCVVPEAATQSKTLDPDSLMKYFEQMTEDALPNREKFQYVLALLLLQKRRLRIDGSRHDGDDEYLQLSGSRGEGPYEVRNHQLSPEEIQTMESELHTHLAAEWA